MTTKPVPRWWQLPFAGALCLQAKFGRCQLCGINYPSSPKKSTSVVNCNDQAGGNRHWFNRLDFLCQACHDGVAWQQAHFQLQPTYGLAQPLTASSPQPTINGIAASYYQLPYDKILRQYKNAGQLERLGALVHALRQLERPLGCHSGNSLLVTVPTSRKRLVERGFDPMAYLAGYLSFHWQLPQLMGITKAHRRHQQGLNRDERQANISGAFFVPSLPKVKHVLVFDDVVTTGATLTALVEAILAASPPNNPPRLYAYSLLHGD